MLLGCDRLVVVNLYARPARDLPELQVVAAVVDGWLEARPGLLGALDEGGLLLAAWGLIKLRGEAGRYQREQLAWLRMHASAVGSGTAWTVGGEARHPSRWHQYVSDRHGRTRGGAPEERLRQVLQRQGLAQLTS